MMDSTRARLAALGIAALIGLLGCTGEDDSSRGSGSGNGSGDGDVAGDGDGFGNGSGNGSGSSGNGNGDGAVMDPGCGSSPFAAEPVPLHLMVVVDASGSMMAPTEADANTSRWQALTSAVDGSLEGVKDRLGLGLQIFPTADDACSMPGDSLIDVSVADGTTTHGQLVSAMGARTPSGGTPTAAALARARRYFVDGGGKGLTGDRVVLLATDGGPSCNANASCDADGCISNLAGARGCDLATNCCASDVLNCLDEDGAVAEIDALSAAGIRTLVVGIPGSELFRDVLKKMATAGGGLEGYFEVDAQQDVAGLTAQLESITAGLITSCKLQLGSAPPDPDKLNVVIDGTTLPQSGPDGWELDRGTTPPTVVIKGATCARLNDEGAANIDIQYGCPTLE